MLINIVEQIGVDCVSKEDGTEIFDIIAREIYLGNNIELDFKGVEVVTHTFLNNAICRLTIFFDNDELNKSLKLTNLSPYTKVDLKKMLNERKVYHIVKD